MESVHKFSQDGKDYTLVVPSEACNIAFRAAQSKGSVRQDGKLLLDNGAIAESRSVLVQGCVRPEADLATVRSWPKPLISKLYNMAHQAGEMDEADTEAEVKALIERLQKRLDELPKNERSATTSRSA